MSDYVITQLIIGARRVVSTGLLTTSLGVALRKGFTDIARFSVTIACQRAHLSLTRYLPPARMFKNLLILPRRGWIDNSGNLWVNNFMDKRLFEKLQVWRKKYQEKRTMERLGWEKELFKKGLDEIKSLSKRDVFMWSSVVLGGRV